MDTEVTQENDAPQAIYLDKHVYSRWRGVGDAVGVSADSRIAAFLIRQFEKAEPGVALEMPCAHCQQPLTLFCSSCAFQSQSPASDHLDCVKSQSCVDDRQKVGKGVGMSISSAPSQEQQALQSMNSHSKALNAVELTYLNAQGKCSAASGQIHSEIISSLKHSEEYLSKEPVQYFAEEAGAALKKTNINPFNSTVPSTRMSGRHNRVKGVWCYSIASSKLNPEKGSQEHKAEQLRQSVQYQSNTQMNGQSPLCCHLCEQIFTSQIDFEQHEYTKHGSRNASHNSDDCMVTFSGTGNKINTFSKQNQVETTCFACGKCGNSFKSVHLYRRHMKSHGLACPFVCNKCSVSFPTLRKLRFHSCLDENSVGEDCNGVQDFGSLSGDEQESDCSERHSRKCKPRRKRSQKLSQCTQCGKIFTSSSNLKNHFDHMHTALKDRPHACKHCNRRFPYEFELQRHLRRHSGEKRHGCDLCSASFFDHIALTRHKKIHAADRQMVICEVCGASFTAKSNLKNHMRIHLNEKPFKCAFCDCTFRLSSTLRKHERKHKGERKFVCSECGRGFTEREYWRSHMRTHTGKRPFVCEVCGAGFAQKGSLNSHKKTHKADM